MTTPIDRQSVEQLTFNACADAANLNNGFPFRGEMAATVQELAHTAIALRAALDEAEAERHRWRKAAAMGSIHTQADLDRAVNEARAVALEEALNKVSGCDRVSEVGPAIRALIDTPAAEALERVRAEAYLSGWVNGSNGVEPPDFGNPVFDDAAIRAQGET